ncbi:hypothetical protein [Salegentibacter sediminis]|uniref:hypothetical protein n=1 Tax=Salegentibacter sediminis TaxID=1930251 RepID=UPI0009BF5CC0|nr:hypothetical protein [Salegentibacter sediminis]
MKLPLSLCFLFFSLGLCAQQTQDLEGTWRWTSPNGEDNFELSLEYIDGSKIRGKHCSVYHNGEKMDCQNNENDYSISLIKIAKNIYDGTIESRYSATAGRIRVQYHPTDVSLSFVLKAYPPGEFYLPDRALMYR